MKDIANVTSELISDILLNDKLSIIIYHDEKRKRAINRAEEDLSGSKLYIYKSIEKFINKLEKYRQLP
ncbi:hypothetical protein NIES4106_06520 [Fischerella sp. NIES-4106]|nr:hypothetical protein NIES4106_06520 [Fischerella sp. NIES-4106]